MNAILNYLADNPYWPLKESVLHQFGQIISRHLRGDKLDPQAVQAIVESRTRQDDGPSDRLYAVRGTTAIIPVTGVIAKHARQVNGASQPRGTSIERLTGQLRAALADDEVEQIVLDIESPGGNIAGLPDFADEIHAANRVKPVVAFASDMAASAAYWIGSQAGSFYANQSAEVGSIGVYTFLVDDSREWQNAGYNVIPITSGEHKATGLGGTTVTQRQIDVIQEQIGQYFGMFLDAVERGRGAHISREDLEAAADGRTYVAAEALELGLIDGITTLDDLLDGFDAERQTLDTYDSTPTDDGEALAGQTHHTPVTEESDMGKTPQGAQTPEAPKAEGLDKDAILHAERARIAAINTALAGMHLADVREKAIADGLTIDEAKSLAFDAQAKTVTNMQALLDAQAQKLKAVATAGAEPVDQESSDDQEEAEEENKKKDDKSDDDDKPDDELSDDELAARIQREWDASADLRAEFSGKPSRYAAYRKAKAAGKVR